MDKAPYIEYNSSNKDYSRYNRKNMTKAESKIWNDILRKKWTGYTFLRQKMLGSFIVDFYCSKLLLAIEIDGTSHDNKETYDVQRTDAINDLGIIVIRYTNEEILNNIDSVKKDLLEQIENRKKHLSYINKNE